ncbi:MAG: DUF3500 domain-containing protein [Verrucomicrobia bacterium]|nr:DUF3500 domain-containing protein [Verrucomicrobiota bacterium]MBI3868392.1 DUF3500 domain-containing protein [Verrucomicrobiota bacterium]
MSHIANSPSDCGCSLPSPLTRRAFLKTAAAGLAVGAGSRIWTPDSASAHPSPKDTSETLAAQLYNSLGEDQRASLCFAFDHPLRDKVDNNWLITKKPISETLKPDQQDLVQQIFRHLHTTEFVDRAMEQIVHDSEGKGFNAGSSVALFGKPGTGKFEFVLTGRHCTRRCDGDTVAGAAFGGPIFYGHQAGDKDAEPAEHPGNVFWYQAKRVNEVFQALDGRQRAIALIDGKGPKEKAAETVKLTGRKSGHAGIRVGDLAKDQQALVHSVMKDLLAPFRKPDADEAMKLVKSQGLENLSLAYFKQQDVGGDGVWDVWQIEGPSMLWYFRGDPHVHCWVHIRDHAV